MSTISSLYIYTGTPPHGYGSQAPKVAETVDRALEYNLKRNTNKTITIGGISVERLQWEKQDGPFPHDQVHGNYITSVMKEMCSNFLGENKTQIDSVVEKVMDGILNQSSDILTQGRQTFCPFREQSVTAAQAYETAFDFLNINTGRDCFSLIDWLQSIMECFEKETLIVPAMIDFVVETNSSDPDTTQKVVTTKTVKRMGKKTVTGSSNVKRERCKG